MREGIDVTILTTNRKWYLAITYRQFWMALSYFRGYSPAASLSKYVQQSTSSQQT